MIKLGVKRRLHRCELDRTGWGNYATASFWQRWETFWSSKDNFVVAGGDDWSRVSCGTFAHSWAASHVQSSGTCYDRVLLKDWTQIPPSPLASKNSDLKINPRELPIGSIMKENLTKRTALIKGCPNYVSFICHSNFGNTAELWCKGLCFKKGEEGKGWIKNATGLNLDSLAAPCMRVIL
jgi:hypothetical protein